MIIMLSLYAKEASAPLQLDECIPRLWQGCHPSKACMELVSRLLGDHPHVIQDWHYDQGIKFWTRLERLGEFAKSVRVPFLDPKVDENAWVSLLGKSTTPWFKSILGFSKNNPEIGLLIAFGPGCAMPKHRFCIS